MLLQIIKTHRRKQKNRRIPTSKDEKIKSHHDELEHYGQKSGVEQPSWLFNAYTNLDPHN